MELSREISKKKKNQNKIKKGIRGIQIKTTLRLHLILDGVAITKKTNVGEDMWKGESLYTVVGA